MANYFELDDANYCFSSDDSELDQQIENAMNEMAANQAEKQKQFDESHKDGADPVETMMMANYMVAAMQYFKDKSEDVIQKVAIEIAHIGQFGINPNKGTYKIPSIPNREFGGYEFLAFYYVSWATVFPEMLDKLNLPFSKAYELALQMMEK
mgnify:FL=1